MKTVMGVLLLGGLVAAPCPQERTLPGRIDAAVREISGFRAPGPVCGDGEFLRRVMLDLVGTPPNAEEVRVFVADPGAGKRQAKVEQLLSTERYADFWARRWMDVFFGNYHVSRLEPLKSLDPEDASRLMESFRRWLKDRLRDDVPWSDIVRDLLEAEGQAVAVPPLAYKLGNLNWPRVPRYENRVVRQFLGIDFSCTGCHDHPFDRWRVDQGYSLMAFSTGRTVRTGPRGLEVEEGPEDAARPILIPGIGGKNVIAPPIFLYGERPALKEVLARALARMVTSPKNEAFSNSAVNRVWAWLLGRGIVHPVDDFNLKNKAQPIALLKLLSTEFKAKGGSFKALIRGICASDAYQRRCDGPELIEKVTFARGVVRPLSAEQIVNSLETATRGRATFDTARAQALAERMVRGEASISEVTEVRPDARALLWLSNSEEVWSLLRDSSVLAEIRKQGDGQVRAMFLAALSREPDAEETKRFEAFLQGRGPDGLEDAYWTLLNSAEFLTRH